MRERRREEKRFLGVDRRSFSERVREEAQMAGLVVEIAFSRVSAARFKGLRAAWEAEGESLRRIVEKRWWRSSGWDRVLEMKVAVWPRIWEDEAEVMVAVVISYSHSW